MEIATIAGLLHPFVDLRDEQLAATSTYIDLLLKWNSRMSLTAIREPDEILTRHFGESYFAVNQILAEDWEGSAIDFGSGAGFPGIPLAISRPKASVTLIESNGKKATFLSEVISQLGLKNVRVFRGRGETFPDRADVVVMRAVERFEQALTVAGGLVAPEGRLCLLIGREQVAPAMAESPAFAWTEPTAIPQSNSRVLLVGKL